MRHAVCLLQPRSQEDERDKIEGKGVLRRSKERLLELIIDVKVLDAKCLLAASNQQRRLKVKWETGAGEERADD